jgi:rRNA processing protein Krr1/Pno1
MVSKEENLIRKFVLFFDGCYGFESMVDVSTYTMGLCDLNVVEEGLKVTLRRPGLLIGKGGETKDRLEKFLECKILIEERTFV